MGAGSNLEEEIDGCMKQFRHVRGESSSRNALHTALQFFS